ncbi:hypothetical protein SOQ14_09565 [Erythrobacter sp. T5W1-R]|uniref:hypothetical protein n=1 Tax=Erythrobacter sp. T5W1-R TaxID=3101752 RepID=UPI002AFE2A02|nr:hypothetical protein [Erythrobacter sp. T5W1-R]MEA1619166.1 hypothetical protein [Erythrobacter sp. T5W1-R]
MRSETRKLAKGQSYPLRPTVLEAALACANIQIDLHLIRTPGDLFDAHFWPPNANIPYERLYVRAGSVPREQAAEARHGMETVVIPRLIAWLANIMAQDQKSPTRGVEQVINLKPFDVGNGVVC